MCSVERKKKICFCSHSNYRIFHFFFVFLRSTSSWITFYYMQNKANHSFSHFACLFAVSHFHKLRGKKEKERYWNRLFVFFPVFSTIAFFIVEMNRNTIFEWNFRIVHLDLQKVTMVYGMWSLNHTVIWNVMQSYGTDGHFSVY